MTTRYTTPCWLKISQHTDHNGRMVYAAYTNTFIPDENTPTHTEEGEEIWYFAGYRQRKTRGEITRQQKQMGKNVIIDPWDTYYPQPEDKPFNTPPTLINPIPHAVAVKSLFHGEQEF